MNPESGLSNSRNQTRSQSVGDHRVAGFQLRYEATALGVGKRVCEQVEGTDISNPFGIGISDIVPAVLWTVKWISAFHEEDHVVALSFYGAGEREGIVVCVPDEPDPHDTATSFGVRLSR